MSKTFRDWSLDQALLLLPSVHDLYRWGIFWRFAVAPVTEDLDLSAILAGYKDEKGQPPYHHAMMVALLLCPMFPSRPRSQNRTPKVRRIMFAIIASDGLTSTRSHTL
jgi:hypothetical protein